MRIGFFGSRGIPACYSGFETFLEQISVRLAARGHDVTVYNRIPFNRYPEDEFKGVRIVRLPTIPTKVTDTIVHTTLSVLHGMSENYDIAYFCGVGNSLLSAALKPSGSVTLVNVDGADFARAKWSGFGRWWLRQSETWASRLSDHVIADNGTIQKRYRELYQTEAALIPYGACVVTEDPGTAALEQLDLQPNDYLLYVSRLTPENAADLTIEAYLQSGSTLPLVVVGDAPYQSEYIEKLKRLATQSPRIRMTGYLFGEAYQQLSFHARAFILPTAIDATRPVLLDQMGFGNCIIARDTPGNVEVVSDTGILFQHADPQNSLAEALKTISLEPELAKALGKKAQQRIVEHYDWEMITTQYEQLFSQLLANRH